MDCSDCGFDNPTDARFCGQCGHPFEVTCAQCGHASPSDFRFCGNCGTAIASPSAQERAGTSDPNADGGERRQLTVMFCDLIESTSLSGRLDPEDMREVLRAFQATCTEAIEQFDGRVAHFMGDGLLVYFGYPLAHEDDAQRAVRAGLRIAEGVKELSRQLSDEQGISVGARVGIHTGLVVIGEMGSGSRRERDDVVGQTPNIAARLQGLAGENVTVISAATQRLVRDSFEFESMGEQRLRGVEEPFEVFSVRGERAPVERVSARIRPLIGREHEQALLTERWRAASSEMGQVVLLSGEAGIGKSRMLRALRDIAEQGPHNRVECRCTPFHTTSPLYPLIDLLERLLGFGSGVDAEHRLRRLRTQLREFSVDDEQSIALLAELLSIPAEAGYEPVELSPERRRDASSEALLNWIFAAGEQSPMLFVLEDLHWADPSTLEFLRLLVDRAPAGRILVAVSSRPEFEAPWLGRGHVSHITLSRLSRAHAADLAQATAGAPLPGRVLDAIVDRADGIPLYIEELTQSLVETELLVRSGDGYETAGDVESLAIPPTLHDSLTARLDRLGEAKEVAQLASTIGRNFDFPLLSAVSPLEIDALRAHLGTLVDAEIIFQRGTPPISHYYFKHALIRDAAYESLLRTQRASAHRDIATALAERFTETAETRPELIAHHLTEGGEHIDAIKYWRRAGRRASERSAYEESVRHYQFAITLIDAIPEGPDRTQEELRLQMMRGSSLMVSQGFGAPAVEDAYARALELSSELGESPRLFPILLALWAIQIQTNVPRALSIADRMLALARDTAAPELLLEAHQVAGGTRAFSGDLSAACEHLRQSIELYDSAPQRPLTARTQDPAVACGSWLAPALWALGYADQAADAAADAIALARQLDHPYTLTFALANVAWLNVMSGDLERAGESAGEALSLAEEHGFPTWLGVSRVWRAATQVPGTDAESILGEIRRGIDEYRETGADLFMPCALVASAQVLVTAGEPDDALAVIDEALTVTERAGDVRAEAELYRIRGEILQHQGRPDGAEDAFRRAIEVARRDGARSFELRAQLSLYRLLAEQERESEIRVALEGTVGWFTEGIDRPEIRQARELLRST